MAKVKAAISLQDSLIERMDKLAHELNLSRSQLFTLAADEFLRRHESQILLEAINRACDDLPDREADPQRQAMRDRQRRLMEGEW
jgi:predicted transcriptional regulator